MGNLVKLTPSGSGVPPVERYSSMAASLLPEGQMNISTIPFYASLAIRINSLMVFQLRVVALTFNLFSKKLLFNLVLP